MTADDVIRALEDGSIYRRKPDEWREMLRVAAQAKASNPNYAHRMNRWPLRVLAFDDYNLLLAATCALASGR
jgi:hypothetical protein